MLVNLLNNNYVRFFCKFKVKTIKINLSTTKSDVMILLTDGFSLKIVFQEMD